MWLTIPAWTEPNANSIEVSTTLVDLEHLTVEPVHLLDVIKSTEPDLAQDSGVSPDDLSIDRPPDANDPDLAEFARRRLEHARRDADEQSADEQRTDLETLGRRLQNVATEESVAELNQTLTGWFDTDERATEPKASPEAKALPFDPKTAQISDVKRIGTEEPPKYVAILVDANGNSMETELEEPDGSQLYETFQIIKRFPLLEQVYRGTVMGLLDKLAADSSDDAPSEGAAEAPATEDREQ